MHHVLIEVDIESGWDQRVGDSERDPPVQSSGLCLHGVNDKSEWSDLQLCLAAFEACRNRVDGIEN